MKEGRTHPLEPALFDYLAGLKMERRLKESSLQSYRAEIEILLKLMPESENPTALKNYLFEKAPATHLRKLIIWKAFLKTCPAPWNQILKPFKLPRLRVKQPRFLTEQEVFQLEAVGYKSENQLRDRLFLAFALQMGLRLSEILRLKFSDIEEGWLKIVRKGEKEQRLPLSQSLQALIGTYLREKKRLPSDWIFPGRDSRHLTPRSAQMLLERLRKRAKIEKKISPHALRHTFATQLAARGASLAALKELLGHEKITTTERYLHVTPTHLQETLALLSSRA